MTSKYHVVYSKLGVICKDSFKNLEEASDDYKLKLELDKKGYFDDRFVLYVEDNEGERVNVKI
jgi:hypothetical protein